MTEMNDALEAVADGELCEGCIGYMGDGVGHARRCKECEEQNILRLEKLILESIQ